MMHSMNRFKRYSSEEQEKEINNSFQISDLGNKIANLPFLELGKVGREGENGSVVGDFNIHEALYTCHALYQVFHQDLSLNPHISSM